MRNPFDMNRDVVLLVNPNASKPRKCEFVVNSCCACYYCEDVSVNSVGITGVLYHCTHPNHPLKREDIRIVCPSGYGNIRDDCPLEYAEEGD